MAERLAPGDYDQLHHFVSAGVWDAVPLETELNSWVVGFWRADHGGNEAKLGRRSWTLAQTVLGSLGSQGAAADVSALCGWADRAG